MYKYVHTSYKCAHARFIASARIYNLCARIYANPNLTCNMCELIYAQILMKFEIYAHKIVIDHHLKFHEDPRFRCGDICKKELVFFNHWFSMYFLYFRNFAPPKPSKMDNYWMIVEFFGN